VANPFGSPTFTSVNDKSLVSLRDGSYVVTTSVKDSAGDFLPVISARIVAEKVTLSYIEGTVLPRTGTTAYRFNTLSQAADGSVVLEGNRGLQGYVDVVDGAVSLVGELTQSDSLSSTIYGYTSDRRRDLEYAFNRLAGTISVLKGREVIDVFDVVEHRSGTSNYPITATKNGDLILQQGTSNATMRLGLLKLESLSPTITQQPASQDATVVGTGCKQVTFTAAAVGEVTPAVQWQQRTIGSLKFTDIAGAVSGNLTISATTADSGTEYRAVFSNAGGAIATAPALLTVAAAPVFTSSPASITTKTGASALFQAQVTGSPAPTISWEVNKGSGWTALASSGSVHIEDGMLVIRDIDETWADAQLRAVAVNTAGTVRSQAARLTLEKAADTERTFTGVVLDWTGSQEWQAKPPNGSAANYFSAGASDGTKETYSAKKNGASILLRSTSGKDTQATYATRAQHITDDNTEAQVIQLTDGTAVVQPDGSAEVTWPATVSVNFYDGLVPFTMGDFTLTVDKAGTGKLVANLSGYSGDMSDPDKPKEAVKPVKNVKVATFKNVVVNTEKGFTVAPEFAGVTVELPAGQTTQIRTGNWGAWPQQFVDFHVSTGLAAYFYTTGGTFDKNKAPAGFAVGFENAIPQVPTNPVEPTQPEEPSKPTVPTDPNLPGTPKPGQTVQGSLVWGVKESFRKYINGPIANGKVSVSDGAIISNDVYWFGQDTTTWKSGSTSSTTNYKGAVKFYGHKGELDLTFSKPVVRIDSATKGTLLITANGKSAELATLDLRNATVKAVQGGISYSNVPVTLTASGAKLFAYGDATFYEAGTEMDPLTFVIGEKATDTPTKVNPPKKNPVKNSGKNDKDTSKTSDDAPITTKDGVTQGSLVWGVKNSFRSYITGPIAKGSITVQNGAASQGGAFWFGQNETNWKKGSTTSTTKYSGAVKFYGHKGVLNLTLGNPAVRVDSASKGTLLVNVNGGGQVEFATLNLAAANKKNVTGGVSYSDVPVTLTAAGSTAFAYGSSNFYPAGTNMDSLSFVIGGTATAAPSGTDQVVAGHDEDEKWTPPATPPATTGILIDPELLEGLTAGSEITATAEGFEPNEEDIKVVVYSEPVVLEQKLKADTQGQATWTGLLPADLEPGTHTLTFQGSVDRGIVFEIVEAAEPDGCYVSAAELEWGFKGTFRNYISGGIAKGEWALTDGVTFSDPHFAWKDGTGAFDTEESAGEITLPGTIQFTGHDGLLNTSIANPTIKITDSSTAYLLLDVSGVSMEDALSGNEDNVQTHTQIPFVELDLSAAPLELAEDGITYTATEVPATITSQGYEAFPNYETGTEFDPVSFTFTVAEECATDEEPEPVVEETPQEVTPISGPAVPEEDGINWILWGGSGVGAAAVLTALVWFVRKRSLDNNKEASTLTDGE
jgi:ribosomal protein L6P/L9E